MTHNICQLEKDEMLDEWLNDDGNNINIPNRVLGGNRSGDPLRNIIADIL